MNAIQLTNQWTRIFVQIIKKLFIFQLAFSFSNILFQNLLYFSTCTIINELLNTLILYMQSPKLYCFMCHVFPVDVILTPRHR